MEPLTYAQQIESMIRPDMTERNNKKRKNRRRTELQKASRKANRKTK